jgi:hypothetical protein
VRGRVPHLVIAAGGAAAEHADRSRFAIAGLTARYGALRAGLGQNAVHERHGQGGDFRSHLGKPSCQGRLRSDEQLGFAIEQAANNSSCRLASARGHAGSSGTQTESAVFRRGIAREERVQVGAGPHQSGADGKNVHAFAAEFGVEPFGKSDCGELAGGV